MRDSSRRKRARNRASRQATLSGFSPRFEVLESRHLLSAVAGQDFDGDDPTAVVTGRRLFYNNSIWDDPGFSFNNATAIAPDKTAYIPNGANTSTFANMSSYSKGINGLMVEITGAAGTLTADDFTIRMSGQKLAANNDPGSWTVAPSFTVTLVPDTPTTGTDRYELVWADGAITNRYLYVIVEGNDAPGGFNTNTGLPVSDVFFFGNLIGDVGTPEFYPNVDNTDQVQVRNNGGQPAFQNNVFDFNRDAIVDPSDEILARNNQGAMPWLNLSLPVLGAALANDTGPDSTPNADGITTDPTVSGTLTSAFGIATFRAQLNGGAMFDALGQLSGGTFTLDQTFLETLGGGPLADGPYLVHLLAADPVGLVTTTDVSFTLKTSITPPLVPDLIALDDTGTSSTDDITKIAAPRIDVTAETGSLVRLYVDGSPVDEDTGAPGLQFTLASLSDGVHNIHVVTQDGAGNSATSPTLPITVSTVLPTISLSTLVTISSDLTPHVNVEASGPLGLANGTEITVDVDLNYDGTFAGAGELDRTTSTLYNGKSFFQVTPALPADVGGAAYNVQLRARVTDIAGNEGTSAPTQLKIDRIGNTVLDDYVTSTMTPTYSLNSTISAGLYTTYVIDLTSQTWRSLADVNKPVWHHWVQIVVPSNLDTSKHTAAMLIDGGNNTSGPPGAGSDTVQLAGLVAYGLQSIVVHLPTVPSEPLSFVGDPGSPRTEDRIIAYTLEQYANNLADTSWPLLLPMVQSAVSAMDLTQVFVPTKVPGYTVDDFLVTGGSKRGWTTWLTAAMDDRVRAIAPAVIDILNMGEQMVHHYGAYSDFSSAIDPYLEFDIPQSSYTFEGQEIGRVIDPYMYIYNGRFDDMPKLLLGSTGDEFFLPDAAEYYFSDLPGSDNYLRYIPNTSHSLDLTEAINSIGAFYTDIVNDVPLPEFSWTVAQDGTITVHTVDTPTSVVLYKATNPDGRDFRKLVIDPSITWAVDPAGLTNLGGGTWASNVATPAAPAATAYFIQLTFPSMTASPHIFTTQIVVATDVPLTDWPFFMPTIPAPGPLPPAGGAPPEADSAAPPDGELDAVAVALSAPADVESTSSSATSVQRLPVAAPVDVGPAGADVDQLLTGDWSWGDDDDDAQPADEEADDVALALLDEDWF